MVMNTSLPTTRKSQFKHIIKFRWKYLFLMGGILIIFAIPLIASLFVKDLKAINIMSTSDGSDVTSLFINDLFYAIFIIPSAVIFFIGLSGIYRIMRNYIWSEGVLFKYDFFIGIKQNWKQFALTGFFFSFLYYGLYLSTIYIEMPFVKYLPLAFSFLFIYPVLLVHMNLTVIYKNNYLKQFINGFIIYVKKFYIYLPLFLLLIAVPFVFLIFSIPLLIKYAIIFIFIYLFIPMYVLLISEYSIYVFDENINKTRHIDLYKKGLFE